MRQPTDLDDYLFDLRGYLVLKNAIEPEHLDALNAEFDALPRDLPMGGWYKNSQRRDYNPATGIEMHNCIEMGKPFEDLVDNPSWLAYVQHYAGEEKSYIEGLFIDESLLSIRESGGYHALHSGGYQGATRGRYEYINGMFRCGQVNILMALNDIGPGDGATMVVPGSHKSNFVHPHFKQYDYYKEQPTELPEAAIEVHLEKGDALLFVDGITHGGTNRTNPGERRVIIYRYGPSWCQTRFGYQYSPELIARVTPQQRRILEPVPPCLPGADFVPVESSILNRRFREEQEKEKLDKLVSAS